MIYEFYKSIIEDEIKVFGIKEESLKPAAISVAKTYSRESLTQGQTFLDYNTPSYRCAYIYKYAPIHTKLVQDSFEKLIAIKRVKKSLNQKKTLKICCLGGGPGTDIVGLFRVLAQISHYHKKIIEVTILDICGGWRNSFKRIISNLIEGKLKGVPDTFINMSDFKFKLIRVDLLCQLPANVVTVISEADIVCMVKFVSAILGSSSSISALEVIGKHLKTGAVVLFIDNLQGNTFKPFLDISKQIGLTCVLGPLHQTVRLKVKKKGEIIYGCKPLSQTSITVLGFTKSDNNVPKPAITQEIVLDEGECVTEDDDDDSWDTEDESESSANQPTESSVEYEIKVCQDKYTQTYEKYFGKSPSKAIDGNEPVIKTEELSSLVDQLCKLVDVLSQFKQVRSFKKHCCHCH